MEKKFEQGFEVGYELMAMDLFLNYKASIEQTLKNHRVDMDFNSCTGNILHDMTNGMKIMWETVADLTLGHVGHVPAVRSLKRNGKYVDTLLVNIPLEKHAEYGINPSDNGTRIDAIDDYRGKGWRARLTIAVELTNQGWKTLRPGDYYIGIDKQLCQVNNMDDLRNQISYADECDHGYDGLNQRVLYIEGVTDMSDEELESYDYFNRKPADHNGGGFTYGDEDDTDEFYGYERTRELDQFESVSSVWMMRGKTKALFVDAEGHGYCKYMYLPEGYRKMFCDKE